MNHPAKRLSLHVKRIAVVGVLAPLLLAVTSCENSAQSAVAGSVLGSLVPYQTSATNAALLSAGSAAANTTANIQASQGN